MVLMGWHRPPRHQPPEPNVVRLVPPERTDPELPEPDLRYSVLRDHETLALEAVHMTPLQAYWYALPWGVAFAVSWSRWVRDRNRMGWLLYLNEHETP